MSTQTPKRGDSRRDEVIAGEYVLGVLSADDRRKVEARMELDSGFAAMVNRWQTNLSSFDTAYEPVRPMLKSARPVELRPVLEPAHRPAGGLWNSLFFWRMLTGLAVAGLVTIAFMESGRNMSSAEHVSVLGELSGDGSAMALSVGYDADGGKLVMAPIAANRNGARSLQVWMAEEGSAPVSLGILPQTGESSLAISPATAARLKAGVTLSISEEPPEGSASGVQAGPLIASGKIILP